MTCKQVKKKQRTAAQKAADAKRTGRRPFPPEKRRNVLVTVSITKAEHARIKKLAEYAETTIPEFLMQPFRKGQE